jgi:putative transposase
LYNCANYIVRQVFINTSNLKEEGIIKKAVWVRYNDLNSMLKNHEAYKALPAQTSQAILKKLDLSWKSFYSSIKDWKKNPSKYTGKPSLPKYKKKDGNYQAVYPGQNINIKDGYLIIPKTSGYKIKTEVKKQQLKELRLIPNGTHIKIEIVYEKKIEKTNESIKISTDRKLGIDIGVNNLMAVTSNQVDIPSFLVNGRPLKSINHNFNKKLAKSKSMLDTINKGKYMSKHISELYFKREMKIDDYFHKASRYVVNFAKENNIGVIIIGKNKGWKEEVQFRKAEKQTFIQIPFDKLIKQIKYKAEEYGIKVIPKEESYTSKVDHLALEGMGHQQKYLGKRVKRGLFKSSTGIVFNADINGAIGIIRKEAGDSFLEGLLKSIKEMKTISRGSVFLPYKLCF